MKGIETLTEVVLRHFKKSARIFVGTKPYCRFYAERILNADLDDAHNFGASFDTENLRRLERNLIATQYQILQLGYKTKVYLGSELRSFSDSDEPLVDLLVELKLAALAIKSLRSRGKYKNTPSAKRNWRAMSVAQICREIWAAEEWLSNPDIYGPEPLDRLSIMIAPSENRTSLELRRKSYERHLAEFAPKSANHNRPGPFGHFVQDVNEALGILAKDGSPVSAATALDALKKFGCQEQIPEK